MKASQVDLNSVDECGGVGGFLEKAVHEQVRPR